MSVQSSRPCEGRRVTWRRKSLSRNVHAPLGRCLSPAPQAGRRRKLMHPIYQLKETGLEEHHQKWLGREVRDRYGRHLGHVKEIMVEERTIEEAASEDKDPRA